MFCFCVYESTDLFSRRILKREYSRVNMREKRVKSKFLKGATAKERVPSADQSTEKETIGQESRTYTTQKIDKNRI